MTVGQKAAVSLLASTIIAAVFAIVAFTGLFQFIETRFFDQRVKQNIEISMDDLVSFSEDFHKENTNKFLAFVNEDFVKRCFLPEQTEEDSFNRTRIVGSLLEQNFGFSGVRIVDTDGKRIHYSSIVSDVMRENSTSLMYRNYGEDNDELYSNISSEQGANSRIINITSNREFVYSFPFVDSFGEYRGSALFYVSYNGLSDFLTKNGSMVIGDDLVPVGTKGVLIGSPLWAGIDFLNRVDSLWANGANTDPVTIGSAGDSDSFIVFARPSSSGIIGKIVPSSWFEMPEVFNWLILAVVFITVYLLLFLILNIKQDRFAVLANRIKRFQIELLTEYMDRKGDIDIARWTSEIETRRAETRERIKKSAGSLGKKRSKDIDELVDKSWDEIINVMTSHEKKKSSEIDLSKLEKMMKEVLSKAPLVVNNAVVNNAVVSDTAKVKPVTKAAAKTVAKAPVKDLEEVEELEELTDAEEVEELEELTDAEPAEELTDAEEVEELEELTDAEPAEEIKDAEEVEELEELTDAEPAEEITDAEPAQELADAEPAEEMADAEPAQELTDAEPAEELTDAEPAEELTDAEPAEEIKDAEEVEELEELTDAEPAEEIKDAEEVEELEELTDAEPAEELTDAEEVEELEELTDAEPAEELTDAEPAQELTEAELAEELTDAEPAEELTDAEPAQELADAEPAEEIAEAEPAEEMADAEPAEELTDAEPAEELTEAEPAEELTDAEPAEELTDAEPAEELTEAEPAEELTDAEPAEELTDAEPAEELTDAEPAEELADAEPAEEIAEAELVEELPESSSSIESIESRPEPVIKEDFKMSAWGSVTSDETFENYENFENTNDDPYDIPIIPEGLGLNLVEDMEFDEYINYLPNIASLDSVEVVEDGNEENNDIKVLEFSSPIRNEFDDEDEEEDNDQIKLEFSSPIINEFDDETKEQTISCEQVVDNQCNNLENASALINKIEANSENEDITDSEIIDIHEEENIILNDDEYESEIIVDSDEESKILEPVSDIEDKETISEQPYEEQKAETEIEDTESSDVEVEQEFESEKTEIEQDVEMASNAKENLNDNIEIISAKDKEELKNILPSIEEDSSVIDLEPLMSSYRPSFTINNSLYRQSDARVIETLDVVSEDEDKQDDVIVMVDGVFTINPNAIKKQNNLDEELKNLADSVLSHK